MSFEHCHVCKPPVRHPGCHSDCSYYQEDLAKAKEYAAREGYEEAKKMKWRPVYMKIDYAHAGIPEYIADSPTELAALCGVGLSTISHSLAKQRKNPRARTLYACVWTRWSDEDYQTYFVRGRKR